MGCPGHAAQPLLTASMAFFAAQNGAADAERAALHAENNKLRAALAAQGRATREVARQVGLAKVRSCPHWHRLCALLHMNPMPATEPAPL